MRIRYFAVVPLFLLSAIEAQTTADFFDDSVLQRVDLRMSPADWQTIHEQYLDSTSYRCEFEWRGIVLPGVGIKSRGTMSRSPIKPSVGLDFGKFASGQRFLGLKSLVMRNLNQDASMMRERLAEGLFAQLGMPHSREAHARLYVNGNYAGVYLLVENVDSRFLQTQVGDDSGYLYDYNLVNPWRFEYLGADPALYVPGMFEPKTHENDPDATGLIETIRIVNQVSDAEFYNAVSPRIDLMDFIAHVAAEQALAQWDGLMGENGMNNFYLYRWGPTRQGMFFVWDQDGAFDSPARSIWYGTAENILMRRALQVPALYRFYVDMVRNAAAVMGGKDGWLSQEISRIYVQIRDAAYEDPFKLCRKGDGTDYCTNEQFENDVTYLRQFALIRAEFIRGEADKAIAASPLRISPDDLKNLGSLGGAVTSGNLAYLRVSLPGKSGYSPGLPLATALDGVSVITAAGPAPLISVEPGGVTFVIPSDLSCAPQPLRVASDIGESNTIMADVMPTASGIFAVTRADGSSVDKKSPALSEEWLALYATGVWPAGSASPPGTTTVLLGDTKLVAAWIGMAPGLAGVEQINFRMPVVDSDDTLPLTITMDGEPGTPYSLEVSGGLVK